MTPEEIQEKKDFIISHVKEMNDDQLKDFAFFLRNLMADNLERDDISEEERENNKECIETCNKILYGE